MGVRRDLPNTRHPVIRRLNSIFLLRFITHKLRLIAHYYAYFTTQNYAKLRKITQNNGLLRHNLHTHTRTTPAWCRNGVKHCKNSLLLSLVFWVTCTSWEAQPYALSRSHAAIHTAICTAMQSRSHTHNHMPSHVVTQPYTQPYAQ